MRLLLHPTIDRGRILLSTLLSTLFVGLITKPPLSGWQDLLLNFLSFGVIAWLMDLTIYSFSIIRVKSILLLCMSLYFLTTILWITPGFEPLSIIVITITLLTFNPLFGSYHTYQAKESGFWVTLLWLLISVISPPLIWLFPLLWMGYYMMRVSFLPLLLSSLVSILLVAVWSFGYLFVSDNMPLLQKFIDTALSVNGESLNFNSNQILWILYMGGMSLLFGLSFLMRFYSDKIRTRTLLEYIMLLQIGCWLLLFLFGFGHGLEHLIALFTALFAAHYLTLVDNKRGFLLYSLILLIPIIIALLLSLSPFTTLTAILVND